MSAGYVGRHAVIALATLIALVGSFSIVPQRVEAFEWGGQFQIVLPCLNDAAIYVVVGAPRGGPFVWTPATATFNYGPPSHVGQYGLGLAGPPYMCLISVLPTIVFTGIGMTMVGTSH